MSKKHQDSQNILRKASAHTAINTTDLSLVKSYVQSGDYRRAQQLLDAADRKQAEWDNALVPRDLFKVTDALNAARKQIRALESRIAKLENRQPVAKATQLKVKKQPTTAELLSMIQAYVDNPSQAGVLGLMLQSQDAVQRERAAQYLQDAKYAHEARQHRGG